MSSGEDGQWYIVCVAASFFDTYSQNLLNKTVEYKYNLLEHKGDLNSHVLVSCYLGILFFRAGCVKGFSYIFLIPLLIAIFLIIYFLPVEAI